MRNEAVAEMERLGRGYAYIFLCERKSLTSIITGRNWKAVEDEACVFPRTETDKKRCCRGGAWLSMLMKGLRQAQPALRLIARFLSATGQRLLPRTEEERYRQRKHKPLHSPQ